MNQRAIDPYFQKNFQEVPRLPCFDPLNDPTELNTVEWLTQTKISRGELRKILGFKVVEPGLEGVTISEQLRYCAYGRATPEYRSILTIPKGVVVSDYGPVLTPDNYLIGDQTLHNRRLDDTTGAVARRAIEQYRRGRELIRVKGRAVCLTGIWSEVYFHWLMEIFPRLILLSIADMPFDKVIMYDKVLPFHLESLGKLGIRPSQIVPCGRLDMIQADELLLPSYTAHADSPHLDMVQYVADLFPHPPQPELNIYWARSRKGNPRLINEEDLFPIMERYGFQILYPEDYTIGEQAEIIRKTRYFLSVHCSGLTNIIFCPPGATIIEIMQQGAETPIFERLAQNCGLNFKRIPSQFIKGLQVESFHHAAYLDPDILIHFLDSLDIK